MAQYITPILLTGLIAIAAAPAPARPAAAIEADGDSATVQVADLDLSNDADVRTLHQRVARAATAVCGSYDMRDLVMSSAVDHCRMVALQGADPQIRTMIAARRSGKAYALNTIHIAKSGE